MIEGGTSRSLATAGYAKLGSPPPFSPFANVKLVKVRSPENLRNLLIPMALLEKTFPRPADVDSN